MKNIKSLISAVLVMIMCLSVVAIDAPTVKAAGETFILDAGHGGSDPGACAHGRAEAADVLAMTMRVGEIMSAVTSVAYTRTGDYFVSLQGRCDIANGNGNSYFCSIHRNSGGGTGVETYYMTGGDATSARMAAEVNDRLAAIGGWRNRGVKTAYFTVITNTWMPAILAEVGFIDSTFDNDIFVAYNEDLCYAIANGLLAMIGANAGSGYNKKLEGYDPVDMGADFYAHIRQTATGLYVTDKDYNVSVSEGVFDASQTWHFIRQGNGSYVISTDSSAMCWDVDNANYSDGTNIKMFNQNGNAAQNFFIYYIAGNFYFKTLKDDKTVDVDANTKNIQIWGGETGIATKDQDPLSYNARSFEIFKLNLDWGNWNLVLGNNLECYIRNKSSGLLLTADGSNAVFTEPTYADNQKWIVTRNEYGGHEIKSAQSGMALDVAAADMVQGTNVDLYEANGSKAQRFFFINAGDTMVYIKPSYASAVLDMDATNKDVHLYYQSTTDIGYAAQIFELITENHLDSNFAVSTPKYFGESLEANIVLVSSGTALTDNTSGITMSNLTDNASQTWKFTYDKEWNAYKIVGSSGKALDVEGAGWWDGVPVSTYESNDTPAQRFRFYSCGNGYIISPVNSQRVIDIDTNTGTKVQLWGTDGSESRVFALTVKTLNGKKPVDFGESFTSKIQNVSSSLNVGYTTNEVVECSSAGKTWTFTKNANGSYEIKAAELNKALDINGGGTENGTSAQLWEVNKTNAQSFFIYESNGGYVLMAAHSGTVLSMDATSKQLSIHEYNTANSNAQTFALPGAKVEATLSSVSVSTKPAKVTYTVGDTLDTTGLALKATYSDGSTKTVKNGFTVSPSGVLNTLGTVQITVTYEGKKATFNVTVNEKAVQEEALVIKGTSKLEKVDTFVKNKKAAATASEIIAQFENTNVAVYDASGNKVASDVVCGTGYTVKLLSGNIVVDSLTIVVMGDVDGSSKVDTTDYLRIKAKFNGTYELENEQFIAGDVCEDGTIDTTDYLRIKGVFVGSYSFE